VRLLRGYDEPLWYKVPHAWAAQVQEGCLVRVPLRKQVVCALTMRLSSDQPSVRFSIREAIALEPFPHDAHYQALITRLAFYYQQEPLYFIERMRHFLLQKEQQEQVMPTQQQSSSAQHVQLTDEQQAAADFIKSRVTAQAYTPIVLHGVTGSGKTEVYKDAILQTLKEGKTAILLLPEVTLALEFERRLRRAWPEGVLIHTFHSAVSVKHKRQLWQDLLAQKPMLIIGVHLPVLLPLANLGLIIVDEEHEVGYQEKKHPKINTKEVAVWRAHLYGVPIVLGSATPSVATLFNVKTKNWHLFQLKKRFAGTFPAVKTVLLTDKKERKHFWISTPLYEAIKDRLRKKEQVILFLNRRGFSFFVQCKSCSFVVSCSNCSVSLTLHEHGVMLCHYCGITQQQPQGCQSCKASQEQLLKKGIGTQQLVSIVQSLFPNARIARADLDTSSKKKEWQHTVDAFTRGDIDIMVGTQTVTKGYDFPGVTLVGVVWADLNLNFPRYNAAEITLQQLIQVGGRAGRHRDASTLIVQAMGHHAIFDYLNEIDYLSFYDQAMVSRLELGYPPAKRLIEIELRHENAELIEAEAQLLAAQLARLALTKSEDIIVLGPAKPPVHTIARVHMRTIYIKGPSMVDLIALYVQAKAHSYMSSLFLTPGPV
jgi:primosomal protein N' (replication factor Y)